MEDYSHHLIWAKLPANESDSYHPLICHSIDTVQVTRSLWDHGLGPKLRGLISTALGVSEEQAGKAVAFYAGCHDIGKATPTFQLRRRKKPEQDMAELILESGFPEGLQTANPPRHGVMTQKVLRTILTAEYNCTDRLAQVVASAVGGHHGIFPSPWELNSVTEGLLGCGKWDKARKDLIREIWKAAGEPDPPQPAEIPVALAVILAGLTAVADWIASHEKYFPHFSSRICPREINIAQYGRRAQEIADRAVRELLWQFPPRQPWVQDLSCLFSHIRQPNALQRTVAEVSEQLAAAEPALIIVEAPTGEGKTEAALTLADRMAISGPMRGIYIAMPTQATGNAMYYRVLSFLERRFSQSDIPIPLQLAHGMGYLSGDMALAGMRPELLPGEFAFTVEEDASQPGSVTVGEWFTHRRRALLAPFGVGTVDQALLGALRVKHVSVRLFGLASKVVVVDEVHAYDTYMTSLLERLFEWLAALGCTVVVLSATLPEVKRRDLVAAFVRGLNSAGNSYRTGGDHYPYPAITVVTKEGVNVRPSDMDSSRGRRVKIQWIAADGVAERAAAMTEKGGCCAVICNTVGAAQKIYRELKERLDQRADDGDPIVDLLHARFPYGEREEREKRVLRRFGSPSGSQDGSRLQVKRPNRAILVTTQVVEQSLDLDFDVMVTELAPVDLLIQRVGRLHRHQRQQRPPGLETPAVFIVGPDPNSTEYSIDRGTESVYHPHLLLRTWWVLRSCEHLDLPQKMRQLVEAVYGSDEVPNGLTGELEREWRRTAEKLNKDLEDERYEADKRWIPSPRHPSEHLYELTLDTKEEEAPEFHRVYQALTRLSEPTVLTVPLYRHGTSLCLDRDGCETVDLKDIPTTETALRILSRSIPVSNRLLVRELLGREPPRGWQRSPLLRHARELEVDADGWGSLNGIRYRLDPELGLCIARETEQ